jgi:imidazolonepropionase-like amidohydrolase
MHSTGKHLLVVALVILLIRNSAAQDTLSRGTYILHKFQQPIGKEVYSIVRQRDSLKLQSDFKFNDRGRDVPLRTTFVSDARGQPVYFKIKGSTSRFSVIDSEVSIRQDSATIRTNGQSKQEKFAAPFFCIGGYSPVAMQMLMIRFWKENQKPKVLAVYPEGDIRIEFSGHDTVMVENAKVVLDRYFVKGLIWGNETLWTDSSGNLIALFANDAEGDKFEAVVEGFTGLLGELLGRAAKYGISNLKPIRFPEKHKTLVLKNADIVDVINGHTIQDGVIVIQDGVLSKIGKAKAIKIPKRSRVIDLSGKTVLPGLWDMHAHFQQAEWGPAYVAAGITTVRDCGNEFDFINGIKKAIDEGEGVGPRIIKAGIVDGTTASSLGIIRVDTEEDIKVAVKKYVDAGFEQIKIYSSVKPEMIAAICAEAHRAGLTVSGHVPMGVTTREAIQYGQDQINHFQYIHRAMLSTPGQKQVSISDSVSQQLLQLLREKNIVVDPTLSVYEWALRSVDQPLGAFEPGIEYIPAELKAILQNTGLPAAEADKFRSFLEDGKKIVRAMHEKGITIVAGTDMMVPGFSLYRELELYTQSGMTPLEAIRTATITPARVMKKEQMSGSLSEGKWADIIIVDGNPLENISNLRRISLVIKGGKLYDPKELRTLVGFKP